MDLHEIFGRNLADDIVVRQGMFIVGLIILILGIIMIIYGYIKRNGTEIQKAHVCFGYTIIMLGGIIIILGKVSEDYVVAALLDFFFTMIAICTLYQKVKFVKNLQENINKRIKEKINDIKNSKAS